MALDKFKIPYTYFGDNEVRQGNLRAKYDVILYPHAGVQIDGGGARRPAARRSRTRRREATPNIGTAPDQTDDRRGGLGRDGLRELEKFVEEGGVLITEGSTTQTLVDYQLAPGVTVETRRPLRAGLGAEDAARRQDEPDPLRLRPERDRGDVQERAGAERRAAGAVGGRRRRSRRPRRRVAAGRRRRQLAADERAGAADDARRRRGAGAARNDRAGGGRGGVVAAVRSRRAPVAVAAAGGPPAGAAPPPAGAAAAGAGAAAVVAAAVVAAAAAVVDAAVRAAAHRRPTGRASCSRSRTIRTTCCSRAFWSAARTSRAAVLVDSPLGKGHVVLFANRPFWRNETHGNFFLGFNAMLNWNDLNAGR